MLEQILTALFPVARPSRAARRFWSAVIVLFPAALAAGYLLQVRNTAPLPVPVTTDRAGAIRIARAYAVENGVPAQSWSASTATNTDTDLLDFVNAKRERIRLWDAAPPASTLVTLRDRAEDRSANVTVGVNEKVVGFESRNPPAAKGEFNDAEALSLAYHLLPENILFGAPLIEKKGSDRTFTFHSGAIADTDLVAKVRLSGAQATSLAVRAEPREEAMANSAKRLQTWLTVSATCFLCLVAVFSIYRYVSRTLQQEVSHRRSLLVALMCGAFSLLAGSNSVIATDSGAVPIALVLLVFAALGLVGGALLGTAYGSGEGDVREAWPGKLTSLDALLSGHVLSRNVGISVLTGAVFAGWITLALGVAGIPFRITEPQGSPAMIGPFARMGWLLSIVVAPLLALSLGIGALLQPLAFLERYVKWARRWHIPLLLICAGLVSTLRLHSHSNVEFVADSAIYAAALLVPFFTLDLLASLICVTGLISFSGLASSMAVAPAFSAVSFTSHAAFGLAAIAFALACVKRGATYTEEEVRPLYARHIAERKSLEAEVSAAREAQLRLLPECVPEVAGLQISAACLPAETVGGDFYDFFLLGDGRLGVFIAEGNNRGLAAALTIALAKGYLMHCVERCYEPVEILARLETALAGIFESGAQGSGHGSTLPESAFAAIDIKAGEIRYARTAAYPKVVVASASGGEATERMVPVKGRGSPIAEGRAIFAEGDHILLFTDGLGKRLSAGNRDPHEVARSLAARPAKNAELMRDRFFAHSKDHVEPDDLTLVVIRVLAEARSEGIDSALGVVA